jgi:hypothetical protein
MNMFSAVSRCTRPAEIALHSWVEITRGITSNGQDRSRLSASA